MKGAAIRADAPLQPKKNQPGLPLHLKIPAISLDAAITQVGLTPDGAMDAPKASGEVAWYKRGPRPGEAGSAVIAGHYGRWANGDRSVFDDLHKLRPGDKVHVQSEHGEAVIFVVRERRSYDPSADASNVFGARDGRPYLNLITCEGTWDKASKSYSRRLVVFTDKEEKKN
jgi:sortase A